MTAGSTAQNCRWFHKRLERLPLLRYRKRLFSDGRLPEDGIYFFYQKGEIWGHGSRHRRIVRIGTHRDGNFSSRMADHFLSSESKMRFDKNKPPPNGRSIFRKNIGRALLNRRGDSYLKVWDLDFVSRRNRRRWGHRRDIAKEKRLEKEITKILRNDFRFRFILLDGQEKRMGAKGLEHRLIGTMGTCPCCRPSPCWLGRSSSKEKIRNGKLWLEQGLDSGGIAATDKRAVLRAIAETRGWIKSQRSKRA